MKLLTLPLFRGWTALAAILCVSLVGIAAAAELPANRHVFVGVANDEGVKYDLAGAVYGTGGNNNTYYLKFDNPTGGLNEIHITNDLTQPSGQVTARVTNTTDPSGTFYLTNTGGVGVTDNFILLLAVNGTLPPDFSVRIRSTGYNWTPNSTLDGLPTDYQFGEGAVDQTFNATGFVYGPQTWKPGPGTLGVPPYLPLYSGQNQSDGQTYSIMFVDLRVGALNPAVVPGLTGNGSARVDYAFSNLSGRAVFNAYGWRINSNQGQGVSWTNKIVVSGTGQSGYSVLYTYEQPVVSAIEPASGLPGTIHPVVTISGGPFISVVRANLTKAGQPDIPVTLGSMNATTINASLTIPAGTVPGSWNVTVTESDGYIAVLESGFTVLVPVPSITSLAPRKKTAGNGGFNLTVNGNSFAEGCLVRWNGANRTTTYVSPTTVTARIKARDVKKAGKKTVTVWNPGPGGGLSNGKVFRVV